MIGSAYGFTSPVKTFAETLYFEAEMKRGDKLNLPKVEELAVYLVSGGIKLQGQAVSPYGMAVQEDNVTATIECTADARIAIVDGEKMPPRFIEWNFVSSRKERIEQAKDDWRSGRFPLVSGDEKECIPLPE